MTPLASDCRAPPEAGLAMTKTMENNKKINLSIPPLSRRSGGTLSLSGESDKVSLRLSLEPYKGTRDFYPEDQFVQNYIFNVWRETAQKYGYLEYNASILEETELYKAKTGEEIVNEQTYSFVDRGGREVSIRPEMTPTVARMVAQKRKELTFPLRWFSIPNIFRYERPQRGRLREHWQLNCDIFGVGGLEADLEMVNLAYDMMKAFGAKDGQFVIKFNSRKFLNYLLNDFLRLTADQHHQISKLLDRMHKISGAEFEAQAKEILKDKTKEETLYTIVKARNLDELPSEVKSQESIVELQAFINQLAKRGIANTAFEISLVRGFDYYTGIVFEMYDTSLKNPRALFGGGRYDDLVSIFGVEKVSGVGFGWGDVTTKDFLETYNLLPKYQPPVELYVCHLDGYLDQANELARYLRSQDVNVAVDLTDRKVSAQVKTADREQIPFVLVVGEEEAKSGKFKVKSLKDGKEEMVGREKLGDFIKKAK
jgi:histidyl-tRNA synthetase